MVPTYPEKEKDGPRTRCTGGNKDYKLYSKKNNRSFKKRELKQNKLEPKLQKVMPSPKLGPQSPPGRSPWKKKLQNRLCQKKLPLLLPKHLPKLSIILYDMLREKDCLKKKSEKLNFMPKN
jgi:hypothetical protein